MRKFMLFWFVITRGNRGEKASWRTLMRLGETSLYCSSNNRTSLVPKSTSSTSLCDYWKCPRWGSYYVSVCIMYQSVLRNHSLPRCISTTASNFYSMTSRNNHGILSWWTNPCKYTQREKQHYNASLGWELEQCFERLSAVNGCWPQRPYLAWTE